MKVSSVLIIVGMVLILLGLALPANFAVINAEPSSTSQHITLASKTPSSTSSSCPTYLPYSSTGIEGVSATWDVSGLSADSPGTSQSLTLNDPTNIIAYGDLGSSLLSTTQSIKWDINEVATSHISTTGTTYYTYVTGTITVYMSVEMPLNTTMAFYFNFTGSITFLGTTYQLYGGTSLVYGQQEGTMLNNGHFYMDVNGTYTKITPTSSVSLFPSEFPFTFPVWYVEDNGTPLNEGSVYLQVNGGSDIEYNLNTTPQSILGYKAWEVNVTFLSQGQYTVNGYAENTVNLQPVLLMSIVSAGNTTTTTTLKLGVTNYDVIGIGVGVLLIGIIWTRFRF